MAEKDLSALTAMQMVEQIASGAASSEEITRSCLDHIEAIEGQVQAFAHYDREVALRQARESDDFRRSGKGTGPLHGVPVALKDIIDTADWPTECGTAIMSGRRPRADATIVARLRAAGAVIVGKTVTTEMAYFTPGKTRNPRNLDHTPGGSSSGTAAAVAAGMVPLAIGSQTNGSIIRPASFCGVFAMKPSHGLVSRAGVLPLSRTLDHMGPFARSVDDLALALDAVSGFDPADPDTRPLASRNFLQTAREDFGLEPRFAFVKTPVWEKASPDARAGFEELAAELGDACFAYDLPPHYAEAWPAHRAVMAAEMAHNLGRLADKGGDKVSRRFHDLMAEGRKVTATDYLDALQMRRVMQGAIEELFQQEASAILTPAAPDVAPKGLEATGDPVFNSLWSLLGLPAITLPLLSGEGGLPIGVQLVGAPGDDGRLLRTANWLVNKLG